MDCLGVRVLCGRKRNAIHYFRTMDRINDYTRYFAVGPNLPRYLPLRVNDLEPLAPNSTLTSSPSEGSCGGLDGSRVPPATDGRLLSAKEEKVGPAKDPGAHAVSQTHAGKDFTPTGEWGRRKP